MRFLIEFTMNRAKDGNGGGVCINKLNGAIIIFIPVNAPCLFNKRFTVVFIFANKTFIIALSASMPSKVRTWFLNKFTVLWTNYNYRGRAVHILNLAVIIPPIVNFIGSADKLLLCQLLRRISVCLVIGTKNGAGYVLIRHGNSAELFNLRTRHRIIRSKRA